MNYSHNRPKTIICDIDGTLAKHVSPLETCKPNFKLELLTGTVEKLSEWDRKGYNIILISGRREGSRQQTERQLSEAGVIYDKLILGVGGGPRCVINDMKLDNAFNTAFAYNVKRDQGIKDLEI